MDCDAGMLSLALLTGATTPTSSTAGGTSAAGKMDAVTVNWEMLAVVARGVMEGTIPWSA